MNRRKAKKIVKHHGAEWFMLNIQHIGGGKYWKLPMTLEVPERWKCRNVIEQLKARFWWMLADLYADQRRADMFEEQVRLERERLKAQERAA